jgi:hypothetical protein
MSGSRCEKHQPPCSPLPILGFHRDAEEAAAVLEAASAEAPPDVPAQSCAGYAELPAAEGVGVHPPWVLVVAEGCLEGLIVVWVGSLLCLVRSPRDVLRISGALPSMQERPLA